MNRWFDRLRRQRTGIANQQGGVEKGTPKKQKRRNSATVQRSNPYFGVRRFLAAFVSLFAVSRKTKAA
jgi:hypothetical protein